jgi:hypothetical protein
VWTTFVFEAHAAPAMPGPLCGITGTVATVELQESNNPYRGEENTEYYLVELDEITIQLPATTSLDARADTLGWEREELVSKRFPATDLQRCKDAYEPEGTFAIDKLVYTSYRENPVKKGQQIIGLVEHGGDEWLAGNFLKGVVVRQDSSDSHQEAKQDSENEEKNERRTLQLRLIELLNQLLSLLGTRV